MSFFIDRIRADLNSVHVTVVSTLETYGADVLGQAVAEKGGNPIVVLYEPAAIAVARGLLAGQPPSVSLGLWKQHAEGLLSLYRSNRRRIVFASAAAVEAEPQRFRTSLFRHLALSEILASTTLSPILPRWSAVQFVLASQTIDADPEARRLDRELEAAALHLPHPACDTDAAFIELEAAAAAHAMQLRQFANVQNELREQFLKAAAGTAASPKARTETREQPRAEIKTAPVKEAPSVSNLQAPSSVSPLSLDDCEVCLGGEIDTPDYKHIVMYVARPDMLPATYNRFVLKIQLIWDEYFLEFRDGDTDPNVVDFGRAGASDAFGPYLRLKLNFRNEREGWQGETEAISAASLTDINFVLERGLAALALRHRGRPTLKHWSPIFPGIRIVRNGKSKQ